MQEGFSFAVCSCWRAASGPKRARKPAVGFADAEPIIEALGRFSAENRFYPEALADLVPSYLSEVPGEVDGYPLDYWATDAGWSFELAFSYSGPGIKGCRYRSATGWACNGYY